MSELMFRPTTNKDTAMISQLMAEHWGGEPLVVRAKNYYPSKLDGILVTRGDEVIGFLFYDIQGTTCEIIVFEAFEKFKGIGTELLKRLKVIAVAFALEIGNFFSEKFLFLLIDSCAET